jgi:hypothetical protein
MGVFLMCGVTKAKCREDLADEGFPCMAGFRMTLTSTKNLDNLILGDTFASSGEPPVNVCTIQSHKGGFLKAGGMCTGVFDIAAIDDETVGGRESNKHAPDRVFHAGSTCVSAYVKTRHCSRRSVAALLGILDDIDLDPVVLIRVKDYGISRWSDWSAEHLDSMELVEFFFILAACQPEGPVQVGSVLSFWRVKEPRAPLG